MVDISILETRWELSGDEYSEGPGEYSRRPHEASESPSEYSESHSENPESPSRFDTSEEKKTFMYLRHYPRILLFMGDL